LCVAAGVAAVTAAGVWLLAGRAERVRVGEAA
jgi:hypothetical protein